MTQDNEVELTHRERNAIEQMALDHRGGLDVDEVERLILGEKDRLAQLVQEHSFNDLSPEEQTAYTFLQARPSLDDDAIVPAFILSLENVIRQGVSAIQELGEYWRFEPCIDCIFDMEREVLEKSNEYFRSYEESDYKIAARQYYNSIFQILADKREIEKEEMRSHLNEILEDFEKISKERPGIEYIPSKVAAQNLEAYTELAGFFEITFPNLLALKRLLDGKSVDLDVIQSKNASSIRRELTDPDELNSPFFDHIVNQFDVGLRNALSHGDIVDDSLNREVQIPTKNLKYSYEEVDELVNENLANCIFLSGTLSSIIEWRYHTHDIEKVSRNHLSL